MNDLHSYELSNFCEGRSESLTYEGTAGLFLAVFSFVFSNLAEIFTIFVDYPVLQTSCAYKH